MVEHALFNRVFNRNCEYLDAMLRESDLRLS
jgi:hypothetical protein